MSDMPVDKPRVSHTDHPLRHYDHTCPGCKADDLVELLDYWRTFAAPSNEFAAVEIIEELQRKVGERDVTIHNLTAAINVMNQTPRSAGTSISEVAFEHARGCLEGWIERAAEHPKEAKWLSGRVEGLLKDMLKDGTPRSATAPIRGMPIIKALKDQRDGAADVLRRLMHKLREESGSEDPMEPFAYDHSWELLAIEADAILAKCPSWTQQLRNIAEGIGMTYEELCAAVDRLPKENATDATTDRKANP